MGIKFNQFKDALAKDLKPTKWKMFKFFIKVGFVTVAASYYLHAVNEQIKKNDNPDIIGSFESVIKQQYEFIKSPFLSLLGKAEGFEKAFMQTIKVMLLVMVIIQLKIVNNIINP